MPLTTQNLRKLFSTKMDDLIKKINDSIPFDLNSLLSEIQNLSETFEESIQEKIQLLEIDFHDHPLKGDYLRTVTEGFDDLDQFLRSSRTLMDSVQGKNKEDVIHTIKSHYNQILVPLLNIIAKLENDYASITTQMINQKQETLNEIQIQLKQLRAEEEFTKHTMLILNKKKKLYEITQKIKIIDLKRQVLQLSLYHDRLNLYYFNHDHPIELKEIKLKLNQLKNELRKYKEENYV